MKAKVKRLNYKSENKQLSISLSSIKKSNLPQHGEIFLTSETNLQHIFLFLKLSLHDSKE